MLTITPVTFEKNQKQTTYQITEITSMHYIF